MGQNEVAGWASLANASNNTVLYTKDLSATDAKKKSPAKIFFPPPFFWI